MSTTAKYPGSSVLGETPLLVDPPALIYFVTSKLCKHIAVYELTGSKATALAFAGDVADLYAGTTPPGTYRTNLARGWFQLGSAPAGSLAAKAIGRGFSEQYDAARLELALAAFDDSAAAERAMRESVKGAQPDDNLVGQYIDKYSKAVERFLQNNAESTARANEMCADVEALRTALDEMSECVSKPWEPKSFDRTIGSLCILPPEQWDIDLCDGGVVIGAWMEYANWRIHKRFFKFTDYGLGGKIAQPSNPGFYWARWQQADQGDVMTAEYETFLPCEQWVVVEVIENDADPASMDHLRVLVPGVADSQSLENFVWGVRVVQ